jgi:ABC-type multidrug transport system fused ATPase/permease subunit
MNLLLTLLPDQALILVIAAIALGLILRIISPKYAAFIVGGIILMLVMEPFFDALFAALPWWLTLLVSGFLLLSLLRSLFNLLLGSRATDHMVGILAADAVRLSLAGVFRLLFMPFRLVGWLLRRGY